MPQWLSPIYSIFNGVPIFFILSGFLIWSSLERTPDFLVFCKKRIFRLYPELWGGVLLSFATVALLYSSQLEWLPYLAFQLTQGTFLQFWTPDSLRGYGCGTPNGSLWTICVMLQAYVVMWVLRKLIHRKKLLFWIVATVVCIALSFTPQLLNSVLPDILYKLYKQTFIPYLWLFMLGMILSEFFGTLIPYLKKFWYIFAIIAVLITLMGLDISGTYRVFTSIAMAPAVIGFSYRCPRLCLKNDYSYGLYIYHMIVINVLIHFGLIGNIIWVLIAFAASFLLAILSYKTIGELGRRKRNKL